MAQEISIGSHGRSSSASPWDSTASRIRTSVISTASAVATSTSTSPPTESWANARSRIAATSGGSGPMHRRVPRAPVPARLSSSRRWAGRVRRGRTSDRPEQWRPGRPAAGNRPAAASSTHRCANRSRLPVGPAMDRRNCSRSASTPRPASAPAAARALTWGSSAPGTGCRDGRVPWRRSGPGGLAHRAPPGRP